MQLDLTTEDAKFLRGHLSRRLSELEDELVHTEKRELQRSLAEEVRRLRALLDRLPS